MASLDLDDSSAAPAQAKKTKGKKKK